MCLWIRRARDQHHLTSHLVWEPFLPNAEPQMTANVANLPIEWAKPWLDSTLVQLTGRLNADLSLEGSLQQPRIQGQGHVDSLKADVPNLGTHFEGHGPFQIAKATSSTISRCTMPWATRCAWKVLVHDHFEDWNFDASIVETTTPSC